MMDWFVEHGPLNQPELFVQVLILCIVVMIYLNRGKDG